MEAKESHNPNLQNSKESNIGVHRCFTSTVEVTCRELG